MKPNIRKGLKPVIAIVFSVVLLIVYLNWLLTPPSILRMFFGGMGGAEQPIQCIKEPYHYKLSLDSMIQKMEKLRVKVDFEKNHIDTLRPTALIKGFFRHLPCGKDFLDVSFEIETNSIQKNVTIYVLEIYDGKYNTTTNAYCNCLLQNFLYRIK